MQIKNRVCLLALCLALVCSAALAGEEEISPVAAEALTFAGVPFLAGTPEDIQAALGPPLDEELDAYGLRQMFYDGFLIECRQGADGDWEIETILVERETFHGPLDLRVDDDIALVRERFGPGDEDDRLMFRFADGAGRVVCALACSFEGGLLREYVLYRL